MKRKRERGSAAIEAALLFPALIFLIIGTADYGNYFLRSYEAGQVAYEAARAGAISAGDKAAAAIARANELIATFGLEGCTVPSPPVPPPGEVSYTTIVVTCPYTPFTGLVPVPSTVGATASYRNF